MHSAVQSNPRRSPTSSSRSPNPTTAQSRISRLPGSLFSLSIAQKDGQALGPHPRSMGDVRDMGIRRVRNFKSDNITYKTISSAREERER